MNRQTIGTLVATFSLALPATATAAPRAPLAAELLNADGSSDEPGSWSLAATPPGPDGRMAPQVSASPELGIAVVFGGVTEHGTDNDTYWFDADDPDAGWHTLPQDGAAPPARAYAATAWDSDQHRMLLFGGAGTVRIVDNAFVFGQEFLNDVWALNFDPTGATPPRWDQLHAGGLNPLDVPSRRAAAAAVYDPVGKRLIVHGGNDTTRGLLGRVGEVAERQTGIHTTEQALDDLWSFDLASRNWTKLAGGMPRQEPNLLLHQAVYDPVNKQVVVTGGANGNDPYALFDLSYNRDTWSFDLATNDWTKWSPDGDAPAMAGGAYGYSEELGALVAARGQFHYTSEIDKRPVYALILGPAGEGSRWEALPSHGLPFPLTGFGGGASGAVGEETVFVMGATHTISSNDGMDLDARLSAFDIQTKTWQTLFSDAAAMGPTAEATAVYDADRNHMLVVGGRGRPGAVWDLDLGTGTWTRVVAAGGRPDGAKRLAAAYDSARQRLLVLVRNRVHTLNLEGPPTWQVLQPLGDAPSLEGASAVYDPIRDRLLLVGGRFAEPLSASYFGGWQQPDFNQEVFALSLSATPAWRELSPAGPSPERMDAGATYDPIRDRILLFGGRDPGSGELNGVIELSLGGEETWRPVAAGGTAPEARTGAVVAYDSANDRLIVYGGEKGDPGTYGLSFAGAPTWSKLTTTGDPPGRDDPAGIYDTATSRLVMFGGYVDGENTNLAGTRDTYALTLGGSAPPPRATSPESYTPPGTNPVRGGTWSNLGPPGARTIPVALSPAFQEDRTVYAGTVSTPKTANESSGVYVSRDKGASWHLSGGAVQGAAVVRFAPSPADPDVVYASARGAESGTPVYVSRDRGETWQAASEGLPAGAYFALAAHSADPAVAWAGGDRGGLFRTVDGGASWHSVGFDDEWVYGVTAIPLDGGVRLLAATRNFSSSVHGSGRAYLSDDLGETWDLVYQDQDYVTYGFAYDPSNPARVLLTAGNGIWRSVDGGRNWEWLADRAIQAAWLAFDPTSDGEVVYGAGVAFPVNFHGIAGGTVSPAQTPGLFRSTDGGESWTRIASTPEEDFGGVSVDASGNFVAAGSLKSGPYISESGSAFTRSASGFMQFITASIGVDAADPDHLVAATLQDGVRVSQDAGLTWKRYGPPDGQPLWYTEPSPVEPGRVLGGNYSTLYKSENGGRTWSATSLGDAPATYFKQPGGFAFHPTDPDTWYVTMANGQVAMTHDNGSSFERDTIGSALACPIPIATSAPAPDTILLGDTCGGGVWRSDDGGETWSSSTAGIDDGNITALVFHPTDPNVVWAGTLHRGVYRSDDGGRTWRDSRLGLGYRYVRALAVDQAGRLYAAVRNGGVYESDDGGASWSSISESLTSRDPLHVAVDPFGRLLAATNGGGVALLAPAA